MTLPRERTSAVVSAHGFLRRLSSPYGGGIKGIPRPVREEARRILRHFPWTCDLMRAASKAPEIFDQPPPQDVEQL